MARLNEFPSLWASFLKVHYELVFLYVGFFVVCFKFTVCNVQYFLLCEKPVVEICSRHPFLDFEFSIDKVLHSFSQQSGESRMKDTNEFLMGRQTAFRLNL